jgi:hypothetical protein
MADSKLEASGNAASDLTVPQKIEAVHRDVVLANNYRLEFIKHCMSLAAAVFVFTVTFMKDIIGSAPAVDKWLVGVGWGAMIVSLLAGLGHFHAWDRFYISYRDHSSNLELGKKARRTINMFRGMAVLLQVGGFLTGLCAIAAFCFRNLH